LIKSESAAAPDREELAQPIFIATSEIPRVDQTEEMEEGAVTSYLRETEIYGHFYHYDIGSM